MGSVLPGQVGLGCVRMGIVAHAVNPNTWGDRGRQVSVSSRTALSVCVCEREREGGEEREEREERRERAWEASQQAVFLHRL